MKPEPDFKKRTNQKNLPTKPTPKKQTRKRNKTHKK